MASHSASATEAFGAALMGLAGLMQTARGAMALLMKRANWPFYRIQVVSVAVVGLLLVAHLVVAKTLGRISMPRWYMARWVFARGACGALSSLLTLIALQLGAPLGDVAALGSINTVAAALLGRLFLGEALQRAHLAGIACAIAGAVMIGLGGSGSHSARAWLGYPLAVLAGLSQAFQFIFARKSKGVPAPFLSVAGTFSLSLMTLAAVGTGLVQDAGLAQASEHPFEAALWLASLGAVLLISTASTSTGGQLCPAAVSATLIMGAGMVSGYVVQAAVFGAEVGPLSLLGAALMMASMLFMASSRAQPAAPAPRPAVLAVVPGLQRDEPEDAATEGEPDDGAESFRSFASFASAEFAAASPTAAVQLQRRAPRAAAPPARAACAPAARSLGAAVVAATCAWA